MTSMPQDRRFQVAQVRGRNAEGRERLPALSDLTLSGIDGTPLEFFMPDAGVRRDVSVHPLLSATHTVFDVCPICLSSDPKTDEHLPTKKLGGSKMTKTCADCNNNFGKYEGPLTNWWDMAYTNVRVQHEGFRGYRDLGRTFLRTSGSGEFGLIVDKPFPKDVSDAFGLGGPIRAQYLEPKREFWSIALFKSAYIAACLIANEVLSTPEGARAREFLQEAVVCAKAKTAPPKMPFAFQIGRVNREATPGRVELVQIHHSDGSSDVALLLAGVVSVTWIFGGGLRTENLDTKRVAEYRLPSLFEYAGGHHA